MFTRYLYVILYLGMAVAFASVSRSQVPGQSPKQPATLGEAQTYYKNDAKHPATDNASGCLDMARSFYDLTWYDRCTEQVDELLHHWPDDMKVVWPAYKLKSNCLVSLHRMKEAHALLDELDARYLNVATKTKMGVPFNIFVHQLELDEQIRLFAMEGKHDDAAAMNDKLIDYQKNVITGDITEYLVKYVEGMRNEIAFRLAGSAYQLFLAGNYQAAEERCTSAIKCLEQSTKDANHVRDTMQYTQRYTLPILLAECKMRSKHYADALQIYTNIASSLSEGRNSTSSFLAHGLYS